MNLQWIIELLTWKEVREFHLCIHFIPADSNALFFYNPLGWTRKQVVSVRVSTANVQVQTPNGTAIPVQVKFQRKVMNNLQGKPNMDHRCIRSERCLRNFSI